MILLLLLLLPLMLNPASETFLFSNSDHQLQIIKLKGEKPGPTALIFGGIHGDEPGSYFSSEMLSQTRMIRGSLILVPRVNFPSIMANQRGIHGDMNRKFGAGIDPNDPDGKVVEVLKSLMAEADLFINQHDAAGFHRKSYISAKYNPRQYGQSLIVDTGRFFSPRLQKWIELEKIGERIVDSVNSLIENPDFHFCFWNHNSLARDTKHPEMRRSATHHALAMHSIPAFGLETSKDLPTLSHKVKYQFLLIKEILQEFGFEFELPSPEIIEPRLYWVEWKKNDREVIRVNSNTIIRLAPEDSIHISLIHANYRDGLSADILNWGTLNDLGKDFIFRGSPETVLIKKNNFIIGRVFLQSFRSNSLREIILTVDGREISIPNWGRVEIRDEGLLRLTGLRPALKNVHLEIGEENQRTTVSSLDREGLKISDLNPDWSIGRRGYFYPVWIYSAGNLAGGFQIELL